MKADLVQNLLDLVKRNYNEIAADFDITRQKEIWPEIKTLVVNLKAGDKILDAGCGNGRLLEVLTDKRIDYLGLDNSKELLKLAQKNYPKQKFLLGDILELSAVTVNNFDYIFCLAVLQHIPSQERRVRVLKELKSKLNPKGQIIISSWNLWQAKSRQHNYCWLIFYQWFFGLFGLAKYPRLDFGDLIFPWKNSRGEITSQRYYHAFSARELKNLVKEAGLKISYLKKDDFNYWLILK